MLQVMSMSIKIFVNGKPEEIEGSINLAQFLKERNIRPEVISVEVNETLVRREDFANVDLKDGDVVEIVFHLSGGQMFNGVLSLVGNTPIVKLHRLSEGRADIWAKLESYNPGGSVKDRIALSMIEDAEKKKKLLPGGTIVEPTSGNTGIGLAVVAAVKGYRLILVMPEGVSRERVEILKSLGAELVFTPPEKGMLGAVIKAEEIAEKNNAFIPQQFENPANPEIHRKTTAEEIWSFFGDRIDAFVAGVGTGGTITGVGEVLKKRKPSVRVVAVEPANSPVLSGGKPGSHRIQGIGAGFIPKILNLDVIDEIITVKDEEAFKMSKLIALKEGILAGLSSGAACAAALKVAERLWPGHTVVTVFPDSGERYLSLAPYFLY